MNLSKWLVPATTRLWLGFISRGRVGLEPAVSCNCIAFPASCIGCGSKNMIPLISLGLLRTAKHTRFLSEKLHRRISMFCPRKRQTHKCSSGEFCVFPTGMKSKQSGVVSISRTFEVYSWHEVSLSAPLGLTCLEKKE